MGDYLSLVSDVYEKKSLVAADDRINMYGLTAEETSEWIMVDLWEATRPDYMLTANALVHFEHDINHVTGGGVGTADGSTKRPARIALLAGADLV